MDLPAVAAMIHDNPRREQRGGGGSFSARGTAHARGASAPAGRLRIEVRAAEVLAGKNASSPHCLCRRPRTIPARGST